MANTAAAIKRISSRSSSHQAQPFSCFSVSGTDSGAAVGLCSGAGDAVGCAVGCAEGDAVGDGAGDVPPGRITPPFDGVDGGCAVGGRTGAAVGV